QRVLPWPLGQRARGDGAAEADGQERDRESRAERADPRPAPTFIGHDASPCLACSIGLLHPGLGGLRVADYREIPPACPGSVPRAVSQACWVAMSCVHERMRA